MVITPLPQVSGKSTPSFVVSFLKPGSLWLVAVGGINESQHNQLAVLRSNVSFALLNGIEVVPGQIHM